MGLTLLQLALASISGARVSVKGHESTASVQCAWKETQPCYTLVFEGGEERGVRWSKDKLGYPDEAPREPQLEAET